MSQDRHSLRRERSRKSACANAARRPGRAFRECLGAHNAGSKFGPMGHRSTYADWCQRGRLVVRVSGRSSCSAAARVTATHAAGPSLQHRSLASRGASGSRVVQAVLAGYRLGGVGRGSRWDGEVWTLAETGAGIRDRGPRTGIESTEEEETKCNPVCPTPLVEESRGSPKPFFHITQASDVGSIPIARSRNLDDSVALTRARR